MGVYTLDFVHHATRLVIEVDSGWHDLPEAQLRDAKRDAWLNGQGYDVTRIRDADVLHDADAIANEIRLMILSRRGDI